MSGTNTVDTITAQPGTKAFRMQANQLELVALVGRTMYQDGVVEPFKDLRFHRESTMGDMTHGLSFPAFCIIAQGSKEVFLGDDRYQYDPMHYLLTSAELPIVSNVIEASQEQPYLSLCVRLDPKLVASVMAETGYEPPRKQPDIRAIDVSPLDADLLDAVLRFVRLVDAPAEAPFLSPMIIREIVFWLLRGEQGDRLSQIAGQEGQAQRIIMAVQQLRRKLDQPLQIEDLAQDLGMSVSSFHHHFKAVTALSPLQYQKQIRLQEARRLMFSEGLDAGDAGFRVGYNDASHFSREYKRLFGDPPLRDVQHLREKAGLAI